MTATRLVTAPIVTLIDGKAVTTSLDVAEFFGRRHDNVLERIRNLDCSDEYRLLNFQETIIRRKNPKGGPGIESPAYRMTRDGFVFLVMGFTGAKAAQFKEAYINAFNRMEAMLRSSQAGLPPSDRRWRAATGMALEASQAVMTSVYETIVRGDVDFYADRWLLSIGSHPDGSPKPQAQKLDRKAFPVTLARLADMIAQPGGMMPSDAELVALINACNQRLAQRLGVRQLPAGVQHG